MSELLEKCKRCVDQAYIDWGKTRLSNREKREVEEYEVWGMVQLALYILNFDEYNKLKSYIWETHGYDPGGAVNTGQMTFFDLYGDKSEQPAVIRCKDCKYYSATTVGMPHACWKDSYMIFGETGEHAEHHVCRRIDSPEHYCSYAARRKRRIEMLKFENECVGCPQGCINCGRKHVAVWVCDECECEADLLWEYEGQQLCQDCLLEAVPKAEMKADEPDDEYDRADYEYDRWKDEE